MVSIFSEIFMRGRCLLSDGGPTSREQWPVAGSKQVFLWEALEIAGKAKFAQTWTSFDLWARDCDTYYQDITFLTAVAYKAEEFGLDISEWRQQFGDRPNAFTRSTDIKLAQNIVSFFRDTQAVFDPEQQAYIDGVLPKIRMLPFYFRAEEMNEARKDRLLHVAHWLVTKARDGHIATFAQGGGFGELEYMSPSEWNVPDYMNTFVRHGFFNRTLAIDDGRQSSLPRGPEGFGVWSAIFFDKDGIELELEIDDVSYQTSAPSDIDKLSPYLRHAVNVALALNFREANSNAVVGGRRVTRPSLETEIKSHWDAQVMGCPLSDKMAERLSYIIRHPESENGVPPSKDQ